MTCWLITSRPSPPRRLCRHLYSDRRICARTAPVRTSIQQFPSIRWKQAILSVGGRQELLQPSRKSIFSASASGPGLNDIRNADKRPQGASTITQQVARNFLLSSRVEIFAQDLRDGSPPCAAINAFSKKQILELYLKRDFPRRELLMRRGGNQLFLEVTDESPSLCANRFPRRSA